MLLRGALINCKSGADVSFRILFQCARKYKQALWDLEVDSIVQSKVYVLKLITVNYKSISAALGISMNIEGDS